MDYIVASTMVIDSITLADGTKLGAMAGGAGAYALAGIRLWSDSVMIATGVGQDFSGRFGKWFEQNSLPQGGLIVKDEKTPFTQIQYFNDGEREETPLYGDSHYQNIEITPAELMPYLETAKGMYIFKNTREDFWKQMLPAIKKSSTKVMWEIGADAAHYNNYQAVKHIARHVDVFSINRTEAFSLFGTEDIELVSRWLQNLGIPLVFMRCGAAGAIMISKDEIVPVDSVSDVKVVDPTGGGNSSSGAVLYGYCEGMTPKACGYMGSLSAAACISQHSVPERLTEAMRRQAEKELDLYMRGK